jgi:S1-C subfamily serine protease
LLVFSLLTRGDCLPKEGLKKGFAINNNLRIYLGTMKYLAINRRMMTIGIFIVGVMAWIALPFYTADIRFNSNFLLDSNNISSPSSSVFVPSGILEANAQTISQNNTDISLRQLFERTQQSVVQVTSATVPSLFNENSPSRSETVGSGFVYDREGHIVTNYHVIAGGRDPENIDVTFSDGAVYRAEVIGTDQYSDLVVLQIQDQAARQKMMPLPIGNSSQLYVGDQVVAIGNPFGLTGTMTLGIISGLSRLLPVQSSQDAPGSSEFAFSIPNIIQTDTAINPGNSGGPLLNMQGAVVGITTAVFSVTGEFAGVGFAVPSNAISNIAPVLIEEGSFEHPWLGVSGTDVTPDIANSIGLQEARGFLVTNVVEGGPADIAGIQGGDRLTRGDIILAVDNVAVRKLDDLLSYLEASTEVGKTITLTILRDGETRQLNTILGARPSLQASA